MLPDQRVITPAGMRLTSASATKAVVAICVVLVPLAAVAAVAFPDSIVLPPAERFPERLILPAAVIDPAVAMLPPVILPVAVINPPVKMSPPVILPVAVIDPEVAMLPFAVTLPAILVVLLTFAMYMLLAFPPKNTVDETVLPKKRVEMPDGTPIIPEFANNTLARTRSITLILFASINPLLDIDAHVIVFPIEKLLVVLLKVIPAVALAMPLSLNKT
jgi:type VI secretion system secreted protein VgrG